MNAGPAAADVLHVDMDCFFAAVEAREDPSLVGRPVVVGGGGPRGVVASASYEARAYGVRSAMAMAEARRRCPHAVVVSPRHGRYGEVSAALMATLREATPLVEPVSLDEAYLDVSGAHRLLGPSEAIAAALRDRVRAELGLVCSVGVGRTKLVAKLASRRAKPPVPEPRAPVREGLGIFVVPPDRELEFLDSHRVSAIPGIGPKTAATLGRMGVESFADLRQLSEERLVRRFGRVRGASLAELARGIDRRRVEPERQTRSIGHEETFPSDVEDEAELRRTIRRQAEAVALRCRTAGLVGRTVSLKLRYGDFRTITRSHSEKGPIAGAAAIARVADALYLGLDERLGLRLLGVLVSSLEPAGAHGRQLELFADPAGREGLDRRHEEVEAATDEIRRRFGATAIGAAGIGPVRG